MGSTGILLSLLLAPTLAGCRKSNASATDAAAVVLPERVDASVSQSAPAATATAAPSVAPAFLKVTPLPPGPIAVAGYPGTIRTGMNDPAKWAGFSTDGSVFGYCAEGGGIKETSCEFVDGAGKVTTMHSAEGDDAPAEIAKRKAIDAFIASRGIPTLKNFEALDVRPPPLTGTWAYTDIAVHVTFSEGPADKDGNRSATIQVGGTVKGDASPVHPITLVSPSAAKVPAHFVAMNVLALSPRGTDLGMVGTFFGGEYSDVFAMKRITADAFASLVYNDAGFRAHQKKDFVRSSELFARAVAADPKAKLPPYNLACAWSRSKDARAKDALAFAIERDPSAKARAKTDKDFDAVKTEPWFVDLTK